MDLLKNPVIIGIIFGIIAYIYLKWDTDKKNLENKNKNIEPKKVNLIIPLAIGLLGWFIAHNYYLNNVSLVSEENDFNISKISPTNLIGGGMNNMNQINKINNMGNMNNTGNMGNSVNLNNMNTFNNTELANLNNPFLKQTFPTQTFMINKGGINIPNNVDLPDVFLEAI